MRFSAQRLIATVAGGAKALAPGNCRSAVTKSTCLPARFGRPGIWRPRPELNRGARICSPLRHHSATWPRCAGRACITRPSAWQCRGCPWPTGPVRQCRRPVCGDWLQPACPSRCWQPRRRLAKVAAAADRAQPAGGESPGPKAAAMTDSQAAAHQHGRKPGASQRRHRPAHHQGHARGAARGVRAGGRARAGLHGRGRAGDEAGAGGPARSLLAPRTLRQAGAAGRDRAATARCWMSAAPPATRRPCWPGSPARWWRWSATPRSPGARAACCASSASTNATVVQGPLAAGVPAQAPFDAILLNGAVPEVPQALLDQLKDGGRLVAIVAPGGSAAPRCGGGRARRFDARTAFDAAADAAAGLRARGRIRVLTRFARRRLLSTVVSHWLVWAVGHAPKTICLIAGYASSAMRGCDYLCA